MAFSRSRKLGNLGKSIDSSALSDFLTVDDSGGKFRDVQYSEITGKPTLLDSSTLSSLVDSSYIQLRQTDVGIDSGQITNLVDSSYVQARQGAGGLDSAKTTNLIDSSYVAARITAGLDSSSTINLVDSDYVGARTSANSGFTYYKYTSTAGQTAYTGADDNGETLSYSTSTDNILVFYNGILLIPTDDYTTSGGDTVTLTTAADSGSPVTIGRWAVAAPAGNFISWGGARALTFMQGQTNGDAINYFAMATPGNASTFGTTSGVSNDGGSAVSDATYAVFAGHTNSTSYDDVQYVTVSTLGNTSTGMVIDPYDDMGSASDGTNAFYFGGYRTNPWLNKIQKFSISTFSGTASDFGDLVEGLLGLCGFGNTDRIIAAGGSAYANLYRNTIQYWNPSSSTNASDFGDLNFSTHSLGGCSDLTRGVVGGGWNGSTYENSLDYVTIASTGNATDFGDLNYSRSGTKSAGTDGVYGVFAGGYNGSARDDGINRITIQTTGNSTDFGNLTEGGSTASTTAGNAS